MIGLFDSGVGGLSVLKAIINNNISDDFIYFGDTKNVPYGTKTKDEILSYTKNIMKFFIEKGADCAIMACNTSSALVYEELKAKFSNKIKIYPLIQYAAPYFKDEKGTIGVMATSATVKSLAYSKEIRKINPEVNIFELECQKFVEIVEKRLYKDYSSLEYIKEKLEHFKKAKCSKIILGCTHFPYLTPVFKEFAPEIDFIDPAKLLIKSIKNELEKISKENSKKPVSFKFCVSKDPESFKQSGSIFFDIQDKPELVEFISPVAL